MMMANKNIWLKIKSSFSFKKVTFLVILILSLGTKVYANENPELIKGYTTAYIGTSEYTYSGNHVREGICGGYKPYLGKTIILYQRLPGNKVGDMIGIYECLDVGVGSKAFQEGKVIDVWVSNKEEIQKYAELTWKDGCDGRVFIQVIDAKG